MRTAWLLAGVVWLAVLASGCGTAAGNYFANRGRDFGECFRLEVNGAMGVGASAEAAGLLHAGLGGGTKPFWAGAGWNYGTGHAFLAAPHRAAARGSSVSVPMNPIPVGDPLWVLHLRQAPPHHGVHSCWWLLPGFFGESIVSAGGGVSRAAMWSDAALREPTVIHAPAGADAVDGVAIDAERLRVVHRWNHVHAFDVSADVYLIFMQVGVGFSVGEFADFVLGWFGADIAGDDTAWERR